MRLMNQKEYSQACLFRIREALETTKSWWEHSPELDKLKIERTMDMLKDIQDELRYFNQKLVSPAGEDDYNQFEHPSDSYDFEPEGLSLF